MVWLLILLLASFVSAHRSNKVRDMLRFKRPTPIVIWHGMGDSCCSEHSLGKIISILEREIPEVYIYSVKLGNSDLEDIELSYFGNVNYQIAEVCKRIRSDDMLARGYHAIGFSQGGQFLRALAQRCPSGMKNLISIGGQQQGVYGLPRCPAGNKFCDKARHLLDLGAYSDSVQRLLIQAQYWHDPLAESTYRNKSIFLADINNEVKYKEFYKLNLLSLKKLVLVKFADDTVVIPKESEWFGFYKNGSSSEVIPMEETRLYQEDRIGLRHLDEDNRLHLVAFEGDHMHITEPIFVEEIVRKFLK